MIGQLVEEPGVNLGLIKLQKHISVFSFSSSLISIIVVNESLFNGVNGKVRFFFAGIATSFFRSAG